MWIWYNLPKDFNELVRIKLTRRGYITYKEVCEMLGQDYDPNINELLKKLDRGMPWDTFCRLLKRYKNDNKN